jgi:hypothetical protein
VGRYVIAAACAAAVAAPGAGARGGAYVFEGGSAYQRAQVVAALEASSFDWSIVPARVVVHIGRGFSSEAAPGEIWLDGGLLDAGTFASGLVQHEYAHEVDFFLFDESARTLLLELLGGEAWCEEPHGLRHSDYGCERFASTLAWAYWPSPRNCLKPTRSDDESAALPPRAFRALVSTLLARPSPLLFPNRVLGSS